jgi:hypothetical protein
MRHTVEIVGALFVEHRWGGGGVRKQLTLAVYRKQQGQLGRGFASNTGLEKLTKLEPDKNSLF